MEPHFDQSDKGFTRVSVLLGAALAVAVVLIVGSPPKSSRPAAADVQLDLPLQEGMQDALSSFIRSKLVNGTVPCADPEEYFQSHLYLRTYTGSISQVRTAPPLGIAASDWDELFQGTMASHGFAGAALSRCSLGVLGTGGRFHFCLNVERDVTAPRGSFLRTPMIFAEVSIQLHDLKSGAPLNCAQYLDPMRRSAGAMVEYELFSIQESEGKLKVNKDRKQFAIRR